MSTIDIYDVAGDKWYRQRTVGGPGQLARGCAVVATAQDRSSFNIYYYGGYDGLNAAEPFSDDVWVLSLPSFTWVNLAPGTDGRAGHKCVTPYPDQMLVIGGYQGGNIRGTLPCLRETVRVFNLSTGTWLDRYDPAVYSEYSVPEAVYEKIGGTGAGGATATTPSPSGWDEDELGSIFATPYPTSKITTYYPYASVGPTNNTNPEVPSDDSGDGGGVPSYLPPVLGTVLGVVFLTVVGVLILLWRRRRVLRGTMSEAGTEDTNGHRITSWLRGQLSEVKTPTVASTDYQPPSATDGDSVGVPPRSIAEMMNTEVQPIAELAGTSPAYSNQRLLPPTTVTDNLSRHFVTGRTARQQRLATGPPQQRRHLRLGHPAHRPRHPVAPTASFSAPHPPGRIPRLLPPGLGRPRQPRAPSLLLLAGELAGSCERDWLPYRRPREQSPLGRVQSLGARPCPPAPDQRDHRQLHDDDAGRRRPHPQPRVEHRRQRRRRRRRQWCCCCGPDGRPRTAGREPRRVVAACSRARRGRGSPLRASVVRAGVSGRQQSA